MHGVVGGMEVYSVEGRRGGGEKKGGGKKSIARFLSGCSRVAEKRNQTSNARRQD